MPKTTGRTTPRTRQRLAARPELRRDGDVELPAGPKALRTRASLLTAASELFSADGYSATSVAGIADRAGVSLGTFYQYFRDRNDVLVSMLTKNLASVFESADATWHAADGRAGVRRLISRFMRNYAESASTVGVWEEVSHIDPEMADLRRALGKAMTDALEKELLRGARQGFCRKFTRAEASVAAQALAGMIDRFCYMAFVFDPPDGGADIELAIEVLADLWANSIDLVDDRPRG